jgi:hypothetical protein
MPRRSSEEAQSATPEPTSQTPNPTASRTRSGRVVKAPERYTPVEVCDDDFTEADYDSDAELSDVSSEASYDSEEVSSESDADENGNLDGFVVEDKSDDSDIEKEDVSTTSGTDVDDDDDA